jgi:hypothetical protein
MCSGRLFRAYLIAIFHAVTVDIYKSAVFERIDSSARELSLYSSVTLQRITLVSRSNLAAFS